MMRFPPAAALAAAAAALLLASAPGLAQTASPAPAASAAGSSGMDAELFYQLLIGELSARGDQPANGFALILDAARKTGNPQLYERAVELALQGRSGDAALQAARAWKQAMPQSREANRYVLQILVALNRVADTAEPLRAELALAEAKDRPALIALVPRHFARVTDKKQAASVVEQVLLAYSGNAPTAAAAWSAIGRMRLAAEDPAGALEAARRGHAADAGAEEPVLLALELMDPRRPQAEAMVRTYLAGQPLPELRMAYARALLDASRYAEALAQLQAITAQRPQFAEAWLVQGTLLVQDNQLAAAEAALQRYLELSQGPRSEQRSRGHAQAYLALAQIAEKRRDFAAANGWLDRIDNAQDLMSAQSRRASILARQGRLEEGRRLLQSFPARTPAEIRMKRMAEVSLLREQKQYRAAYELLLQMRAEQPEDPDLLYDQAMMAEKLGNFAETEQLLRQLMAARPDFHHAYNALGYALAERNERLPEARQLIQKALEHAPGDPYITDSLGWVEFRLGNGAEALRLLQTAFQARPDAEIAAHLGEVLWSLGQREQAQAVWREGLMLNDENETLLETLKRFGVTP